MQPIRHTIRSYFAQLDARLRAQQALPAPSRQTLLDPLTTLLGGDLVLIGACHSEHAERVLNVIALDVAPARDVLIVSQDPPDTALRLISIVTGIPASSIARSEITREEIQRVQEASRVLTQQRIEVSDAIVYQGRADVVADWFARHGSGIALLESAWPASFGSDEDGAAEFVRSLKAIARESSGTIVIPWRLNSHHRTDPRPMLRDLAVSGAAEDDADLVLLVHDGDDAVEILAAKNRHGSTGLVWDSREQPGHVY